MCLVDVDSTQKITLQGYWIKYNNTDIKTASKESVVHPEGRIKLSEIRKQVELQDFSTLTYIKGSCDKVELKKVTDQDTQICHVQKDD